MRSGLIIAGNSSHAGKTSAAIGLISVLRNLDINVRAAKCGPDYLDASWLQAATRQPVANLDLRMAGRGGLKTLLGRYPDDCFLVIESAMGLFDGDQRGRASAWELAKTLNLPILLLLNVKGMGQTAAALAEGLVTHKPPHFETRGGPEFCGLVCSNVASEKHWRVIRKPLQSVLRKYKIPLLGYLPSKNAPKLESRHLGLKAPQHGFDFHEARKWFSGNCSLPKIPSNVLNPATFCKMAPGRFFPPRMRKSGPVIAIARDEAFCFCYADLPAFLEERGARIVFFSPLLDAAMPECDGCYLPGGYPELFGAQLGANIPLLESLKDHLDRGMKLYAECGGYIYLMKELELQSGEIVPMAGILAQSCRIDRKLQALGYRKVQGLVGARRITAWGHEFHYGAVTASQESDNLWQVRDSADRQLPHQGVTSGNIIASWIHLYPEGSRQFWKAWLDLIRQPTRRV